MIPSHGTFCLIFWWDFFVSFSRDEQKFDGKQSVFSPQDCWEEERAPVCAKSVCICILKRCVWWGGGLNARHWRPFCTHILCMCLCVCVLELSVWRLGANTPGQRHGPRRLGCEQLLPPCTLSAVLSFLPVPSLQNTQISVNIHDLFTCTYLLKVAALKRLHELCWCFCFSSSAVSAFLEGWTWGHRGRGC